MVGGDEVPCASIPRIDFDGVQVPLDVQAPCRGPAGKFGLKFRPLFGHANRILTFVMEQQGGGLDESLHQKHFFTRCFFGLQGVP